MQCPKIYIIKNFCTFTRTQLIFNCRVATKSSKREFLYLLDMAYLELYKNTFNYIYTMEAFVFFLCTESATAGQVKQLAANPKIIVVV